MVWRVGEELMVGEGGRWYRAKVLATRAQTTLTTAAMKKKKMVVEEEETTLDTAAMKKTMVGGREGEAYKVHFIGWKARHDRWVSAATDELCAVEEAAPTDDYEVDRIVGKRRGAGGEAEYLVAWRGYSEEEQTWEPRENLQNAQKELANFEAALAPADRREERRAAVKPTSLGSGQCAQPCRSGRSSPKRSAGGGGGKRQGQGQGQGQVQGQGQGQGGKRQVQGQGQGGRDGAQLPAWDQLWASLLAQGWREESGKRVDIDRFFLPPGVSRSAPGMRCRRDFFDSKRQVRQYLEAQQKAQRVEGGGPSAAQCDSPGSSSAGDADSASRGSPSAAGNTLSLSEQWKAVVVESARELNRSEKNIHAYVTPGELQLQLQTLGKPCAQAVLRTIRGEQVSKVTSKRVQKLREQLVAAVAKIGAGHNGAKAGLNAVCQVLCPPKDAQKHRQQDPMNTGTSPAAMAPAPTPRAPKIKALAKSAEVDTLGEQAMAGQRQVQADYRFAEELAAAACAGAAAAEQAQFDAIAAGGVITDGLGLLSPFAREAAVETSAAGSVPLSLASPAEKNENARSSYSGSAKKKLVCEPHPEWARAEQLGVQLPIKHADQSEGVAEQRKGGARANQAPAVSAAQMTESRDAGTSAHCHGQRYRDLIGLARGLAAERVLPRGGTEEVPMPGVQTIELPAAHVNTAWRQPEALITADGTCKRPGKLETGGGGGAKAEHTGAGRNKCIDSGRQVGALKQLREAAGWTVDYECDSVDEVWLLSPEGGSGRSVSVGELEELIDLFERSHAQLKWVQPVLFEKWCEHVLGNGVRTFSGPWLTASQSSNRSPSKGRPPPAGSKATGKEQKAMKAGSPVETSNSPAEELFNSRRVIREVALEHCYNHWSIRRKEFGCSLVRSLRDLQRPVRSNRSASPRYTEMSEKDLREMIAKEQREQLQRAALRTSSRAASQQQLGTVRNATVVATGTGGTVPVFARRVGVGGTWTRYQSQNACARALKLDASTIRRACRTHLTTGDCRVVGGWEIRPDLNERQNRATSGSAITSTASVDAESGLAVAAALERLVRQVEGKSLDESEQVVHTVERLVDSTARPSPPPATAPHEWVRSMKTEWLRERSERVARRRRQVLEAVATIRLSRSRKMLSQFESLSSNLALQLDDSGGRTRACSCGTRSVVNDHTWQQQGSLRKELFKTPNPVPKPKQALSDFLISALSPQELDVGRPKRQQDRTAWNHEDDVLLCQLYGYFFKAASVVRGRWENISHALGTRTPSACRHRYNLIKSRAEMVAATAKGTSSTELPQPRELTGRSCATVIDDASITGKEELELGVAGELASCQVESERQLLNALHLAREAEAAARERAAKKRRRCMSELEKKEETGRRAADDAMVWSTTAEWAVRRAALKRRQHFGGVLVDAGTAVTELDDSQIATSSVAASHTAANAAAGPVVDRDQLAKAAGKRKRQSSPSKNKQKRSRRGKNDLGDGVNTWRVAVRDTSGGGGAPRLATVAIGWETDPAKDPTGYVGKPIREYWYKAVAKDDETPSQIAKKHHVDCAALVDYNQRRWYPDLQASSRLIKNTFIMVPTDSTKPGAESATAKISATNYVHWRAVYDTGDQVDLDEADVRLGFWLHRCHEEGWQTAHGDGDGYVGRRVRVARPGGGFIHATVVGYIGQGEEEEDREMWHIIHDDGDDEDLWRHEVEAALRDWEAAELGDLKGKFGSAAVRMVSSSGRGIEAEDDNSSDDSVDLD